MAFKPIPRDQIQGTAQVMLAYLDDPKNSTPNNLVEAITSGKSLLRQIIQGNLVVCAVAPDAPPKQEEPPMPTEPPKPTEPKAEEPEGKQPQD